MMGRCYSKFYMVTIFILALYLPVSAFGEHLVSVSSVEPVLSATNLKLRAMVDGRTSGSSAETVRDYRITVKLPAGVRSNIRSNEYISVVLPVVRNRQTRAKVVAAEKTKIQLLLASQVQRLEGQSLTIEVPLASDGLYLIPPQAIYAPRGLNPQVFVVTDGGTAQAVSVDILQVADSGKILVSSSELKNQKIIFRGLNNLISGDKIQIVESKESLHD